ncbi:Protein FAR1-RELATED SEQUENCE 5 [Abeliophyllum distichum]|uniref:Protein FAR1-RELATED SEQUENCE 5 n=1 Tax=Abeliophyllum distichum TaxID=126358 RepID=A0ABD1QGN4_9LAMI
MSALYFNLANFHVPGSRSRVAYSGDLTQPYHRLLFRSSERTYFGRKRIELESVDNMFIPKVSVGGIPIVGQEFESHDAAYSFYNGYAREAGFSARIANSKKKETNETYWKLFVCSKEGKTDDTYQRKHKGTVPRVGERNRGETRLGCGARLSVVKQQIGDMWVVNKFIEEHNHALTTPSKVHLLRSHRSVSATKKALTQ